MSGPRASLSKLSHKDKWSIAAIPSGSTMQLSQNYDSSVAADGDDGPAPGSRHAPEGENNRTMYTTSVHIPPGGAEGPGGVEGLPDYDQTLMMEGGDDDGDEASVGLKDGEGREYGEGSEISSAAKVRFSVAFHSRMGVASRASASRGPRFLFRRAPY